MGEPQAFELLFCFVGVLFVLFCLIRLLLGVPAFERTVVTELSEHMAHSPLSLALSLSLSLSSHERARQGSMLSAAKRTTEGSAASSADASPSGRRASTTTKAVAEAAATGSLSFYRAAFTWPRAIKTRLTPDFGSNLTQVAVDPDEVIAVTEVVHTTQRNARGDRMVTFVRLADGRGWLSTTSRKEGRKMLSRVGGVGVSASSVKPEVIAAAIRKVNEARKARAARETRAMSESERVARLESTKNMFKLFDVDHNGCIKLGSFRARWQELTGRTMNRAERKWLNGIATNKISLEEFVQMVDKV